MFESLYNSTCIIKRREASSKDGSKAADTYINLVESEPCIFLPKVGKTIPNDGTGRDIVLDGEFRMNTEVFVSDKITHDGYDYLIVDVQNKKDIVTGITRYYRASVTRQRVSPETPVTVTL